MAYAASPQLLMLWESGGKVAIPPDPNQPSPEPQARGRARGSGVGRAHLSGVGDTPERARAVLSRNQSSPRRRRGRARGSAEGPTNRSSHISRPPLIARRSKQSRWVGAIRAGGFGVEGDGD